MVGIALIAFLLLQLVPGDVVDVLLGEQNDPELAAQLRRQLGTDRPVQDQLADWTWHLLQGDLGRSLRTGRPVLVELADRLPATIELAVAGLLVALAIGLPVGIISALRPSSGLDLVARLFALVGLSMPNFWLGLLLILVFSVALRWLPSGGFVPLAQDPVENLKLLAMPAVTLGVAFSAIIMRMTRSAMLDVLLQDYMRTAVAKGLPSGRVVVGHGLRNALIPIMTVVGIQAGRLLGGTVVVETIFSWPGVGQLILRAISQRDYPLVQGAVMLLALIFVLSNLIVDLLYAYVDPRIRNAE